MSEVNAPTIAVLHCAATPDFERLDVNFDQFGAKDINLWHIQRGFKKIGYHFVIRRTGVIEDGRPILEVGAHCHGHNDGSIGVCWVGTRWPSKEQVQSIISLHSRFWRFYGIRGKDWFGHRELEAGKDCPGISMDVLRALLTQKELVAPIL
jgi:N-acetylmuramoyl-L-alanine amidase